MGAVWESPKSHYRLRLRLDDALLLPLPDSLRLKMLDQPTTSRYFYYEMKWDTLFTHSLTLDR